MAKRVQRRRGTTSEHGSFTGFEGEITVDTTIDTLRVHDGSLAGGHVLAKADGSNLNLTNAIGIVQLNVADGDAGDFLQTDGNNNLSFETVDVGNTALGGNKLGGTISAATIDVGAVGISELAVADGLANQFLKTDGAGTLSFGTVVTDPSLTGDIGGTTSANVIGAGKVLSTHLVAALKNFTVDSGIGSLGVDTFALTAAPGSVNSVIAYIDGIVQPPSAYALLTSPNRLQFTTAPPVGSIIRIVHLGFQSTVGVPSDGSITNVKLATNSVESDNIVNGTIATDDIANNAITDAKIDANTITAASIAANTITNIEIDSGTITGTQIADNTIGGDKINIAGNVRGDIMYYDQTNNWVRLAPGTSGHVLTTLAANANPYWAAGSSGTALPSVGSSGNVLTSDGSSWASAVVPVATTTVSGSVELATQAEVTTGTDTARSITPATLEGRLNASIARGDLKTTTGDVTSSAGISLVTGPGGEYGFWPTIKYSTAAAHSLYVSPAHDYSANGPHNQVAQVWGTALLNRFTMGVSGPAGTVTARQRYIQASPPYDIGDGECHSFIFLVIDNSTGKIESGYHAPDPVWANNGPTCIHPTYKRNGKSYRIKQMIDKSKSFEDPDRFTSIEQEITNEFKNSDMALHPHPFQGNDLTGKSIVLIDPNCDIVYKAEQMKGWEENALEELFHNDYVRFGNEHIKGRCTPCGHGVDEVMVVKPTWKNSK